MSRSSIKSKSDIMVQVKRELDPDGEFDAFVNVEGKILRAEDGKKLGFIMAILVARKRIPEGYVMSVMDGHSQDMQWLGSTLFEPQKGRMRLQSLVEDDTTERYFMFITEFHLSHKYRSSTTSDISTFALHQFLHHDELHGTVCTAVYILDSSKAMTKVESESFAKYEEQIRNAKGNPTAEEIEQEEMWTNRLDELARKDANAFLRNGFFQDPAIARDGGPEAKILVASHACWTKPLKSHAQAVAVKFVDPPTKPPEPTGVDARLFDFLRGECSKLYGVEASSAASRRICKEVDRCVKQGASVKRVNALQIACATNCVDVGKHLISIDKACVNAPDENNWTPLMVAATNAAGRSNAVDGCDDTRMIDLLLKSGAKKEMTDAKGMTAYGHFKLQMEESNIALSAMTGKPYEAGSYESNDSIVAVEDALLPPDGPTEADLNGGLADGFVDFKKLDSKQDEEEEEAESDIEVESVEDSDEEEEEEEEEDTSSSDGL